LEDDTCFQAEQLLICQPQPERDEESLDAPRAQRRATLSAAFEANPIRFGRRPPQAPTIPEVVWINPPIKDVLVKI
jgi:hypothetical protein